MTLETTTENIMDVVTTAALDIAAKLGLTERKLEWRALHDDETLMMVTPEGINIGKLKVEYGDRIKYRYEIFRLNGVPIVEKRYGVTDTGWEHFPAVTVRVNEEETYFYWEY